MHLSDDMKERYSPIFQLLTSIPVSHKYKKSPAVKHYSETTGSLDHALSLLEEYDAQKAELVELRFFAGLSGREAAKVLGISPSTADRHWSLAKAWLQREIVNRDH